MSFYSSPQFVRMLMAEREAEADRQHLASLAARSAKADETAHAAAGDASRRFDVLRALGLRSVAARAGRSTVAPAECGCQ